MAHPHIHWPWSPTVWPYRVHFTRAGSYYSSYSSLAYTFKTRDEAAQFLAEQLPKEPKGCKSHLMRATVPDGKTWGQAGRWVVA